jgi:hypothetical protein
VELLARLVRPPVARPRVVYPPEVRLQPERPQGAAPQPERRGRRAHRDLHLLQRRRHAAPAGIGAPLTGIARQRSNNLRAPTAGGTALVGAAGNERRLPRGRDRGGSARTDPAAVDPNDLYQNVSPVSCRWR